MFKSMLRGCGLSSEDVRDERPPSRIDPPQILLSALVHTIQAISLLIIVNLT